MPSHPAAELARRLGEIAEVVCRHYLSNGRRQGRYWLVGDVNNSAGSSLYVRLTGPSSGKGARGRWVDAASGEYGDLLDLIRLNRGHDDWRETLEEAREFLRLPRPARPEASGQGGPALATRDTVEAARRLFRSGRSVAGTPAATYLAGRGLARAIGLPALRYHPRCYHRVSDDEPSQQHPALLAAVTDLHGTVTGVARTWLAPDGRGKAALADPRRSLGHQLGHGVRFPGAVPDTLVAGEGLETTLSVHAVMPAISAAAALSANHLAALVLPPGLRRLYVARDGDPEGVRAYTTLRARAEAAGVPEVWELVPAADDFNTDLMARGPGGLALHLAPQLAEQDAMHFLRLEAIEPDAVV
ncbi:DUF7146 domain-containing protein [Methylobacterium nodulans]|uniref:Uncharacterized protein n=1 Tax=Methylobacterium nodulans (strain LMG 21967 / CNCM I-2342 / ORS 2060) TaxID=460265 RepID=B8IVJ0_METNO|nr:toprim domain-containing protein [Methylobacterium nodulans]ACL62430.1 conserved hypothetical protein [Methylobacterium nodulans ORS 2060]